jgi:hypothetical protein
MISITTAKELLFLSKSEIKGYGVTLEDADQFLAAIEGVLEGIGKVTLQAALLEWMDRSRKCIATNGEYTE